jgi:hypothetical protein
MNTLSKILTAAAILASPLAASAHGFHHGDGRSAGGHGQVWRGGGGPWRGTSWRGGEWRGGGWSSAPWGWYGYGYPGPVVWGGPVVYDAPPVEQPYYPPPPAPIVYERRAPAPVVHVVHRRLVHHVVRHHAISCRTPHA